MLTIVIPNRNRKLEVVRRTLHSITSQDISSDEVEIIVVDYGSDFNYQKDLRAFVNSLKNIHLICCPTQGQLWNKSRIINIVLKSCKTPFFMVVDMDMLFHPQAINKIKLLATPEQAIYFKVGVLTEEESKKEQDFSAYDIKFHTNEEATGITLFPTAILKTINGFDEFYHGWGAEDTDVHVRLQNAGIAVNFYQEETLFLHQWHPKHYRSPQSTAPFHDCLEQINHKYLMLSRKLKKQQANQNTTWGLTPDFKAYKALENPTQELVIPATQEELAAFLIHWGTLQKEVLSFTIIPHKDKGSLKTKAKQVAGKKLPNFITLETANARILEHIINYYRNYPYTYSFDRQKKEIRCVINLNIA